MNEATPAYPLCWPAGWRRTPDGSVAIPLQPWAGFAIIDAADVAHAMRFRWTALRGRNTTYVYTRPRIGGVQGCIYLHRMLLDAPGDMVVDHKDHDGLNNRRDNLRLASYSQNGANSRPRPRCYSQFRGVTLNLRPGRRKRWTAQINSDGKHIVIGLFDEELVAAAAYDIYAKALHGEFAQTNLGVHMGTIR